MLYNTCILSIFLYGLGCWVISNTDACGIDALDQWCLRMLLVIKWHQSLRNHNVRRLTKQHKLTAIIQLRQLTLFGRIACMDDYADAKQIMLAFPPMDWRRQPGHPRIMWLSTVLQDLRQHNLTLLEAAKHMTMFRRSSGYGSELPHVENAVSIWCYTILSCMP